MTLQEAVAEKRVAQAARLIEEERLGDAVIELIAARQRVARAKIAAETAGQCRWMRRLTASLLEEAEEHLQDRSAVAAEWGVL
jgi:predicted house-cleaning noncanonical NTP pyrophosphatase (MazG superfamily)